MLIIEYKIKKQRLVKKSPIDNKFRRQVLVQFLNNVFKDENSELLDIYLEEDKNSEEINVGDYQNTGKLLLPNNLENIFDDFKLKLRDYNCFNI